MIWRFAMVYFAAGLLFQSFLDQFIILVAVSGAGGHPLRCWAATGDYLKVESFMGAIHGRGHRHLQLHHDGQLDQ